MIEPKYHTLNTLFADRVFRIPRYQRFYSWQKRQREDLFSDIEDLYAKDKDSDRHHFMATIVCFRTQERQTVKSIDYGVFEIVDGQQRITTLVMMLKTLEEYISDDDITTEIRKILVKDDENLLLLQTNNINQHLFNQYLRAGKRPSTQDIKTHADRNFADALKEIRAFIDRWQKEERTLLDLLRIIRNRIGFVVYDTEESHAVYTVFECLNSRGLEVDWLDKAKSMLMGIAFEKSKNKEVAADKLNELHNLWANVYNSIAQYPVEGQEILRVTATLYLGGATTGRPLSGEESLDNIRDFCVSAEKTIEVTGWIQSVTEILVDLHNSKQWAPVTKILQARILAAAIKLSDVMDDSEREKALDQWERVSFRIYGMYEKDSRTKVGDYVRLAIKIVQKTDEADSAQKILSSLIDLGKEYPIKEAVSELTSKPRYEGYEEQCRYILWRYEEHLAAKEGASINSELREKIWKARSAKETIEHIFPQSQPIKSDWEEKAKGKKDIDVFIHSLGNYLLLPPGLNSEAGNRDFKTKKGVYKKAEGLRIVSAILKNRVWNFRKIKEREKLIADFLSKEFDDVTLS